MFVGKFQLLAHSPFKLIENSKMTDIKDTFRNLFGSYFANGFRTIAGRALDEAEEEAGV